MDKLEKYGRRCSARRSAARSCRRKRSWRWTIGRKSAMPCPTGNSRRPRRSVAVNCAATISTLTSSGDHGSRIGCVPRIRSRARVRVRDSACDMGALPATQLGRRRRRRDWVGDLRRCPPLVGVTPQRLAVAQHIRGTRRPPEFRVVSSPAANALGEHQLGRYAVLGRLDWLRGSSRLVPVRGPVSSRSSIA